jgi:hypothetical protein
MRRTILPASVSMLLAAFAAVSPAGPDHAAADNAAGGYFYHDSMATSR